MEWSATSAGLVLSLGGLLLSAGIEDVRDRNIANWKNAAIALLAPVWWWSQSMLFWPDIGIQIIIAVIVFALFVVAFLCGQMGGGDVKLIGALALWLPLLALQTMLLTMSLIGGALTLVLAAEYLIRGRRSGALAAPNGGHLTYQHVRAYFHEGQKSGAIEFPYGVAIAIAGLLALPRTAF